MTASPPIRLVVLLLLRVLPDPLLVYPLCAPPWLIGIRQSGVGCLLPQGPVMSFLFCVFVLCRFLFGEEQRGGLRRISLLPQYPGGSVPFMWRAL